MYLTGLILFGAGGLARLNAQNVAPLTPGECAALRGRLRVQARSGRGDVPAALSSADRCANLAGMTDAQRVDSIRLGAQLRAQLGDPVGAEKGFRRALELMPNDAASLFALAQVLRDRPDEGFRVAERAARAATTARRKAAAYRLAGEIKMDSGDMDGARSSFVRALKLADDDLETLKEMLLANRDRPHDAAAYALRALGTADAAPIWLRPAAYRFCAHLFLEIKDSTGAVKSFQRALAVDPDDLEALEALVQLKQVLPDSRSRPVRPVEKASSEADLLRMLKNNPDSLEALHSLIRLRLDQKNRVEAVALTERFTDAIVEAPEWQNISAYLAAGILWLALDEEALARQSIRNARDLDPRSLEILRLAKQLGAGEGADDDPTPSDAYVSIGRAHVGLGDPAGAEKNLGEALRLLPAHLDALSTMTYLMLAERRLKEALDYSDRLIAASEAPHPKSWELAGRYNQLPWEHAALYSQRAEIQLESGDEAGARKSLKRALVLVPNDDLALRMLADIPQRKARKLLELKALPSAPAFVTPPEVRAATLVDRARSERERKDDGAAAASLALALALTPDHLQALDALARLEADRGRPAQALAVYDRMLKAAAKKTPAELAAICAQKARLQREMGDIPGERASLERARALFPEQPQVLAALIQLDIQARRLKTAMTYAEELVTASRNAEPAQRAAAYRQRAMVHHELKDEGAVQEDFKRALDAAPEDLAALWMMVSAEPGLPREALALVEAHRPAAAGLEGEWLALRAMTRARLNDRVHAEEDLAAAVKSDAAGVCSGPLFQLRRDRLEPLFFDRCVERFPSDPKLYTDRGVARYLRGQSEGAVADFRKAADLQPDDLEAHLSLASALAALGRTEEASIEANKAGRLAKKRQRDSHR